ncbi:hypothetical protein B0T22DRAFT_481275 [Podospora appendiculata]|uniref:Uncharacterized protein n=1 Tax=Podospora appendiculata TaxID=314037 RepID=A0AAE0XCC4_9PEZI|nr:hypothetical protein B0T22DRAFT_481275 [Podospora appendiculata]
MRVSQNITVGQETTKRQKALEVWRVECRCSLCCNSKTEMASSDARRRQIERLRGQVVKAFQDGKPFQALRLSRQVLNLLPSEELFPLYSEQYEHMARAYWFIRNREKTMKYAKMSLEVLVEQGYIERDMPEHLEAMWKNFAEGR